MSELLQNERNEAEQPEALPEQAAPLMEPEEPKKVPLTYRTSAKVAAFLLAILMIALTCACVMGAALMVDQEIYTTSEWSYRHDAFENMAERDCFTLIDYLNVEDETAEQDAMRYLSERNIASVEMKFSEGPRSSWGYGGGVTADSTAYTYTWYHMKDRNSANNWYSYYDEYAPQQTEIIGTVEATIYLADNLRVQDHYFWADRLISAAYALRYAVYGIGAAALVLAIVCFVFLMCASGRRRGFDAPQPGWGTKVPLDLLTLGVVSPAFFGVEIAAESFYYSGWFGVIMTVLCGVAILVMVLGWCMSLALRLKLGGWWKNTVVYQLLRLCWYLVKKLWAGLCALGRGLWRWLRAMRGGIAALFRGIPLVKGAVFMYLAFVLLEGNALFLVLQVWYWEAAIVIWALIRLFLFPAVILFALMLRRLQQGGEALAAGNLNHQVDTTKLVWEFKSHGENLNRIGEGMTAAVEQRMKSERMKTELITNVSHDIKTPLTSIINYTDLIEKEPCDNPKITEYAGVLHRQSDRLKRLIDDLVEASKASTGNLEVLLAPCEVGVMLTQTVGEYELRLRERNLELVTKQPALPVKIMADGRRLWRVFDNLMNNICKYGQSGTRVYLTLEEKGGYAVISFKNTSREPLNLTEDELMERFVRGDSARNSEGNGLGLSIAKSLTELQNGSMELTVDGDLFKVILRFPTIN